MNQLVSSKSACLLMGSRTLAEKFGTEYRKSY